MKSQLLPSFIVCFNRLPETVRETARKNYRLWVLDPRHPSLHFKNVGHKLAVYSIRVGIGYRALALVESDVVTWFWIGSHADYDRMIANY